MRERIQSCRDGRSDVLDLGLGAISQHLPEILSCLTELGQTNRLRSLSLDHLELGPANAALLARFTRLENLELVYCKIGDYGAQHLAGLTALRDLNLQGNNLTASGARHLAALSNLRSLVLYDNKIGLAGITYLTELPALQKLELSGNGVGAKGMQYISRLAGLTSIGLDYNQIGDEAARQLMGLNLTELRLGSAQITDVTFLDAFPDLEFLNLSGNDITVGKPDFVMRPALKTFYMEGAFLDAPKEARSRYSNDDCLIRLREYYAAKGIAAPQRQHALPPSPFRTAVPKPTGPSERCFISYAHGDETDASGRMRTELFQATRTRLETLGLEPFYDTQNLAYGESIDRFMSLGAAQPKIVVILSERYLRSLYCMDELRRIWRHCGSDRETFKTNVRSVCLHDAAIWCRSDQETIREFWQARVEESGTMIDKRRSLGARVEAADLASYNTCIEIKDLVVEILSEVADTIHARSLQEVEHLRFS